MTTPQPTVDDVRAYCEDRMHRAFALYDATLRRENVRTGIAKAAEWQRCRAYAYRDVLAFIDGAAETEGRDG